MATESENRIIELGKKIERLRNRDWRLRVFGAAGHRYRKSSRLGDAYLTGIEAAYDIALPEDYRNYLQYVGNGGAGPCYGILPLQESLLFEPDDLRGEYLSSEFPHTGAFAPSSGSVNEEEYFSSQLVCGSLPVAGIGCGNVFRLVITGSQKGTIWSDNRASGSGIIPVGLRFYDWYDQWLRNSLASLKANPLSWMLAAAYRACGPSTDVYSSSRRTIYPK